MSRFAKFLLVPVMLLGMSLAVMPQESEARWGRWGRGWRRPYVAHYAPYHHGYRVYRPHRVYYHAPYHYGPRVYVGGHGWHYHYGW
jgi:hypothetical protein